jgi:hypothetical protein
MLNLSELANIMTWTLGPEMYRQNNRASVLAARVPLKLSGGPKASWPIQTGAGATAVEVSEGSDVIAGEYVDSVEQRPELDWAELRAAFSLSDRAVATAQNANAGDPAMIFDLFGEKILQASTGIASKVNSLLYAGTGTATFNGVSVASVVGFGAALANSGDYAGITRSSYTNFYGNVVANGGVARPLSIDLMSQLDSNVFTACNNTDYDIFTTPTIKRRYEDIFESRRFTTGGGDLGSDNVSWHGKAINRDKDCTSGRMYFINSAYVELAACPAPNITMEQFAKRLANIAGTADAKTFNATMIPAQVVLLGKTGSAVKGYLSSMVALKVKRPNSMGYISDIA